MLFKAELCHTSETPESKNWIWAIFQMPEELNLYSHHAKKKFSKFQNTIIFGQFEIKFLGVQKLNFVV